MASTAKLALKPYVAAWLDELDACYELREAWNPALGCVMEQRVLIHPPVAQHTGRLHHLIQSDYSPLVKKSKIDEYMESLRASGQRVPLSRSNFHVSYFWDIIKKWDRWKSLLVIEHIDQ